MSRFNRSEIMKAAHRYVRAYKGREWSYALLMSWGLKAAWKQAKDEKTPDQRRAESIRAEIDALKYKSVHVNFERRHTALQRQLSAIAA